MRTVQAIVTLSCALGVFASPVQAEQHLNRRSPWSRRHGGHSNEHYARQEDDIAVGPNTSVDPTTLTQSEVLPDFQSLLDAVIDPGSSTENPTPISTPPPDPVSSILSDILDPVSSVASEVVETLSSVASEVVDPTSSSTEDPVVSPSSSIEVPPELPSSSESISTPVEPSVVPSSQEPPPAPSSTSEIIVIPPPSSSSEPVIPSSSEEPVIPSSTPDPVPSSSTEPPPEPSSSEQPPLSSILSDLSSFLSSVVDPITDPPISSSTIIEEPPISSSTEEPPPPPPSSSSEPPPPPPSSSSEPPPPPPSSSSEDPIISSSSTISVSVPSSSASSSSAFDPDDIFPSGSSGVVSPSITLTSTSSLPPVELDSSIAGLLTETSFALATLSSSSSSITITDPDAPLSTVSSRSVAEDPRTLEVEKPVLPPNFPSSIAPQDAVASCVGDDTQINILFDDQVNWKHVTESKNVPEQMLAYLPRIVERCLSYDNGVVGVKGLEAFIPKDVEAVDGTVQDLTQLGTLFVGCIPTQGISTLESYIRDSRSCFYNSGNDVADQIAARVVKSYNIAQNRPNEDGDTISISNPNGTDHSRRNAIIGVCVAFGTIALGVFIWWLHKTRQQRREGAHRRLSYQSGPNYGTHINALGPQRGAPLMAETPGMRRNSFYAVGPDNESFEEETFDYMSQNSQNWGNNGIQRGPSYRRPVVGQPISQPILRETSMGNW